MRHKLLRVGVVVLVAVASLCVLTGAAQLYFQPFASFEAERENLRAKIKVGVTEAEVIRSLGDPHQVQSPGTGQQTCQLSGFSHSQKLISTRCLIYLGNHDAIAYVYIDNRGRVEDVYVGGS